MDEFGEDIGGLIVDCSASNLSSIPTSLTTSAVVYKFSDNPLKLDQRSFHGYGSMQYVSLSSEDNDWYGLDDIFAGSRRLRVIVFPDEILNRVPQNLLSSNTIIRVIHNLNVDTIPEGLLDSVKFLRWLDISTEQSQLSGDLLHSNKFLETLSLKADNLVSLPDNLFAQTPVIKNLTLNVNKLTNLPPALLNHLTTLKHLQLSGSRLDVTQPFLAPAVIEVSVVLTAINTIDYSSIHNLYLRRLRIQSANQVVCRQNITAADQRVLDELEVTQSNLTSLSGKQSTVNPIWRAMIASPSY